MLHTLFWPKGICKNSFIYRTLSMQYFSTKSITGLIWPLLDDYESNASLCWPLLAPSPPSAVGWTISDSCAVIGCSRRRLPWHSGCCTASAPQYRQASDHPAYYPLPFFSPPLPIILLPPPVISLLCPSFLHLLLLFLFTITERPEKQQKQNQVGW